MSTRILSRGRRKEQPEYHNWRGMWERCTNPRHEKFRLYGGRGITVCERWNDLWAFIDDMGRKPSDSHSIERIDGNRNYEPGNCRWATQTEQMRNTSRNRMLTLNGETLCLSAWSEKTGIPYQVLIHRFERGWTVERALTTTARKTPKIFIECDGLRLTIRGWAKFLGINSTTLRQRYSLGWTHEAIIRTPIRPMNRH